MPAPGVVDLKVVRIEEDQFGGGGQQTVDGVGTGFVYNRRGDIVTNDHVAGGAKSITVKFSDNQTFKARVVGRDTDSDLAVIRVAAPRSLLHPLKLGDSSRAQVGDAVVAIGSPFGHAGSLSAGVVSGLHVPLNSPSDIPTDSIQTDAAINPGSSGGPLLNTLGQVIGIATSTQSRSGNSNGVGFVIPSNIVRSVVVELVAGRKVKHAYFGASLEDSTLPLGARLVSVSKAGPSADAGMKKGDVVTGVDGVGVTSAADMISLTRAHLVGRHGHRRVHPRRALAHRQRRARDATGVTSRLLAGVAAIALAVVGGVVGAAIYASSHSAGTTTTVVNTVTTGGTGRTADRAADRPHGDRDLPPHLPGRRRHQGGRRRSLDGGSESETSEGSGFVYDAKGNILTNQHVVDGANSISVKFWNGSVYKAHVVGADSFSDLAIVKVSAPPSILHPLTIGNSGELQVGDGVVAIGSPFGLSQTMTSGIVSALHRGIRSRNPNRRFTISDSIQTDAPINHGNSGGPLLNASGHVIGVNTQIQSDSGGSDGVGFAVSSSTIQRVAPKLVLGQKVEHAYLGVVIEDASTASNATAAR